MIDIVNGTLTLERHINAPTAAAWDAYVDPAKRARWSLPAGEAMVYDETYFSERGRDRYRCGLTWEFEPKEGGALVKITSQLASFVGQGMIDGNRNGHAKALEQLSKFLVGATLTLRASGRPRKRAAQRLQREPLPCPVS